MSRRRVDGEKVNHTSKTSSLEQKLTIKRSLRALGVCFIGLSWILAGFIVMNQKQMRHRRYGPVWITAQEEPVLFWSMVGLAFTIGAVVFVWGVVKLLKRR